MQSCEFVSPGWEQISWWWSDYNRATSRILDQCDLVGLCSATREINTRWPTKCLVAHRQLFRTKTLPNIEWREFTACWNLYFSTTAQTDNPLYWHHQPGWLLRPLLRKHKCEQTSTAMTVRSETFHPNEHSIRFPWKTASYPGGKISNSSSHCIETHHIDRDRERQVTIRKKSQEKDHQKAELKWTEQEGGK